MIRSQTDYGDKRRHRPKGKTKGQFVPMDKRLVEMYENYLIYHRPNATGSEHIEYIGLHAAQRYAEGGLRTDEYACLSIFKSSGRRPGQIAFIKCKDFSYSPKYTGSPTYVVLIPKSKVRGGKFCSFLKPYALVNTVAQVVELHIKEQTAKVEGALKRKMTPEEKGELPLFIDVGTIKKI
jgi:hypothetical protein